MNNDEWYFKFDPNTGEYIPGATHEKVDNSTTQDPAGVKFPVFDITTNTWKNDATKQAAFDAQKAAQPVNPETQQAAQMFQQVVELKAEFNAWKLQNATTETTSQTASQSASQSTSTAMTGGATNA